MFNENFLGFGGFLWFIGVVEDRNDPEKIGRCKVRILGSHTENKTTLPTSDLPWASCMLPITASGISGIGQSATGLLEGSWVFGFFKDGTRRQEPLIMGSLPGKPAEWGRPADGFSDPNARPGIHVTGGLSGTLQANGTGLPNEPNVSVYPREIGEPDVNRLAVANASKPHPSIAIRLASRTLAIPTAIFSATTAADGSTIEGSDGETFDQPANPYAAIYPYNHVYESESGHLFEFDDTENAERIHLRHRTGIGFEMHPNGDQTTLTNALTNIHKGIVNTYITKDHNLTIDKHYKIFVNKNGETGNSYDLIIGANSHVNIHCATGNINLTTGSSGKINLNSGGDTNFKVGGNLTIDVGGSFIRAVSGSTTENTTGEVIIRGSTINLNEI